MLKIFKNYNITLVNFKLLFLINMHTQKMFANVPFLESFTSLKRLLTNHAGVLTYFLDPVALPHSVPYQQISPNLQNVNFLYPVIHLVATILLYGNLPWIVHYSFSNGSFERPRPSQLHYYPQVVLPLDLWPQSEVACLLGIATAAAVLLTFVGNSDDGFSVAGRYEVRNRNIDTFGLQHQQLTFNGIKLAPAVSAAILATHHHLHRWFFKTVFCIWLMAIFFCYIQAIVINGAYSLTVASDVLFLLLFFPLHIFYTFYGLFGVSIFVIMACSFLHIRQRAQLEQLKFVESRLNQNQNSKPLSKWGLYTCWCQYLLANRAIIRLAVDIQRHSALWTLSLTVYLSGFICMQCYLIYIVFFMRSFTFASKFLLLYRLVEVEVFQFLLIHICAKVAKANSAIEKVNQRLCIRFSRIYCLNQHRSMTAANAPVDLKRLLKAEWLQSSHRLKPYCFHLLDNYRITSKTFYMSFSYNALFFLMIFKRQ